MKYLYGLFVVSSIFCSNRVLASGAVSDDPMSRLLYAKLVKQFYSLNNNHLYWFNQSPSSKEMRVLLLHKLDSSIFIGTGRDKYHYNTCSTVTDDKINKTDSIGLVKLDRLFTDAAIAYCKDLYQGSGISGLMKYDDLSGKCASKDNDFLIGHLATIRSANELLSYFNSLEPVDKDYLVYKAEFKTQYALDNVKKTKQLAIAMNSYRWVHHFGFDRYVVVNIGSATLRYYGNGTEALSSKVVVGKFKTKTPRFAAYCTDVVLYPYWNVPRDIAVKELLPKFKRNPARIDAMNMQLINSKGQVVNHHALPWGKFTKSNFPYAIRQCSGCDNSLGVLKFNLTDPFSVYMHDTNFKIAFKSGQRYLSHGCIRVEKAIELGNNLLDNRLDTAFLKACIKDEKPVIMKLEKPVPVFVLYSTVESNGCDTVKYYTDVYHLYNTVPRNAHSIN